MPEERYRPPPKQILHIEEHLADAELIAYWIGREWPTCVVTRIDHGADYKPAIKREAYDLILADYGVRELTGLAMLDLAHVWCGEKPFIFVAGRIGEEQVADALLHGAADFVCKDSPARLIPAIRSALTRSADVARRQRLAETLRQNQERFQQITENVADMIAVLDLEGRRLYNNPSYWALFGDPSALHGTDSFAEIHSGDRERIRQVFAEMVRTGVGRRSEYRFLLSDGSVRHIESQGNVIRDAEGQVTQILVVSRDISERLAAERKLRDLAALLDKARDAIIATSEDFGITYWNHCAETLYGWTSAEALGRNLQELGLGYDPLRFVTARTQLFAADEWRGYFTLQARDGHIVQVETTWSLVRGDDGIPRAILVIDTDITAKRRLEAQLLQAQRVESIGILTGGIAHDLNNILGPIKMSAELLRRWLTEARTLQLVDNIEAGAQHGVDLVQQLLTFARGAEGERLEINLAALLEELTPLVHHTLRGLVHYHVEVAPDINPVLADPTQLKQVILNLCINAVDAMPQGGRLTILVENILVDSAFRRRVTDSRGGPHVCVSVIDMGTGIPPTVLDKIFDPFFTTKAVGKGTGLGLSTVYGIVQGHGGFLQVESEMGRGTTFRIYLPAVTVARATVALPPAAMCMGEINDELRG